MEKPLLELFRGHFIIDAALNTVLTSKALGIPVQSSETSETELNKNVEFIDPDNETVDEINSIIR